MSFIVIEGDNGTGKDTLALKLEEKYGYRVITNEEDVKALNKEAKTYEGKERVKKFLEYGKVCSDKVEGERGNTLLVRYWLSTLAAAYADNIFSYEETLKLENSFCSHLKRPDGIIFLWCDFETRIERIKKRKSTDFDDVTRVRNDKYKWFLDKFQQRTNIKFINIDTTHKNEKEVFEEISNRLKELEEDQYDCNR